MWDNLEVEADKQSRAGMFRFLSDDDLEASAESLGL